MCLAGWCALVYTAAAVTTTHALVSSSEEVIKQALVLVDILRSGYGRRSSPSIRPITRLSNYASVPWPQQPFYAYGPPFRRFYGTYGDVYDPEVSRRLHKLNRQIQYDDAFGAHPSGDEKEKIKNESTSLQKSNKSLNSNATNLTTTTSITTISSVKKSTEALKSTYKGITEITTRAIKRQTGNTTYNITKTDSKNGSKKPESSITVTANIMKLNYIMKDTAATKVTEKDKKVAADEPEMVQVAEELKREAADTAESVQYECATTTRRQKASSGYRTRYKPAAVTSWRFRGTTRVYLSRSSRPSIPLPDNNPFCHTNPESPLCRTFI